MSKEKMQCFQCGEEITPDNNGMCINKDTPHEMYQCNDCHLIEFGHNIYGSLLVFPSAPVGMKLDKYKKVIAETSPEKKEEISQFMDSLGIQNTEGVEQKLIKYLENELGFGEIESPLPASTDAVEWIELAKDKPPSNTIVHGYNSNWVDEDFNPEGIRECFLTDEGNWISANWNNSQDCWDNDEQTIPTHWMQRQLPPKP